LLSQRLEPKPSCKQCELLELVQQAGAAHPQAGAGVAHPQAGAAGAHPPQELAGAAHGTSSITVWYDPQSLVTVFMVVTGTILQT
jgi:hypothetical protein